MLRDSVGANCSVNLSVSEGGDDDRDAIVKVRDSEVM